MTTLEVVTCPDRHFRRAIYGLGPYIADYPEQALLACIVQDWCPKYVRCLIDRSMQHVMSVFLSVLFHTDAHQIGMTWMHRQSAVPANILRH